MSRISFRFLPLLALWGLGDGALPAQETHLVLPTKVEQPKPVTPASHAEAPQPPESAQTVLIPAAKPAPEPSAKPSAKPAAKPSAKAPAQPVKRRPLFVPDSMGYEVRLRTDIATAFRKLGVAPGGWSGKVSVWADEKGVNRVTVNLATGPKSVDEAALVKLLSSTPPPPEGLPMPVEVSISR